MVVRLFAVSLFAAFMTAGCAAKNHNHSEYATKADIAAAQAAAERAEEAAKRAEVAADKAEVIFHKSLRK